MCRVFSDGNSFIVHAAFTPSHNVLLHSMFHADNVLLHSNSFIFCLNIIISCSEQSWQHPFGSAGAYKEANKYSAIYYAHAASRLHVHTQLSTATQRRGNINIVTWSNVWVTTTTTSAGTAQCACSSRHLKSSTRPPVPLAHSALSLPQRHSCTQSKEDVLLRLLPAATLIWRIHRPGGART